MNVQFTTLALQAYFLLIVNGLFWSVAAAYYRTLAYQHVDVSVTRIFGTLNLLLLTFSGIIIFGEQLTFLKSIGILLTILAILVTVDFSSLRITKAIKYIGISSIFSAIAISMNKFLSAELPVPLIVMSDFLIPGLTMLFFTSEKIFLHISSYKSHALFLFALPALCGIGYSLKIKAFALGGELVTLAILEETGLLFIITLEYIVLKSISNLRKRCFAGALSSCGAILVLAF